MKVGNVSFGARLTQGTFDFLVKAKTAGLNTKKMENLMKDVCPDEFIRTDMCGDKILKMGVVENPNVTSLSANKQILNGNVDNYCEDLNADHRIILDMMLTGEIKPYKINQDTINEITKKLEDIRKNTESPESNVKKQIIDKFGYPV